MARCQVTESAHRRLSDFLTVAGRDDSADERLDATHLADDHLVLLIIACQIGEYSSGASHNVDVAGAQQLNEALHQVIQVVLKFHTSTTK